MTDTGEAAPHFTPVTERDRAMGRATARATGESAPAGAPTRAARLRARGASVATTSAVTEGGHAAAADPGEGRKDGWWWLRARWWNEGPNAPAVVLLATRTYHADIVDSGEPGIVTYPYKVLAVLSLALSVTAALLGALARPGRLVLAIAVLAVLAAVAYGTGFAGLFTDSSPTGGTTP